MEITQIFRHGLTKVGGRVRLRVVAIRQVLQQVLTGKMPVFRLDTHQVATARKVVDSFNTETAGVRVRFEETRAVGSRKVCVWLTTIWVESAVRGVRASGVRARGVRARGIRARSARISITSLFHLSII